MSSLFTEPRPPEPRKKSAKPRERDYRPYVGFDAGYDDTPLSDEQRAVLRRIWYTDGAYWGRDKLWKLAREELGADAPGRRKVLSWLIRQELYQRFLPHRPDKEMFKSMHIMKPGVLQVDIITVDAGGSKKRYIFSAIDVFSRHVWLYASNKNDIKSSMEGLKQTVESYEAITGRKPRVVWTDLGDEFGVHNRDRDDNRSEFTTMAMQYGMRHLRNPVHVHGHHVERLNATVRMQLSRRREDMNDPVKATRWGQPELDTIATNINAAVHDTLKMKPSDVLGLAPNDPRMAEVRKRVADKSEMVTATGRRKTDNGDPPELEPKFKKNDLVRVGIPKLAVGQKADMPQFSRQLFLVDKVNRPKRKADRISLPTYELDFIPEDQLNPAEVNPGKYYDARGQNASVFERKVPGYGKFIDEVPTRSFREQDLVWANEVQTKDGERKIYLGA